MVPTMAIATHRGITADITTGTMARFTMGTGALTDISISGLMRAIRITAAPTAHISVATVAMGTNGANGAASCARAMDTGCRITPARIGAPMARVIIVGQARVSIPRTGRAIRATITVDRIAAMATPTVEDIGAVTKRGVARPGKPMMHGEALLGVTMQGAVRRASVARPVARNASGSTVAITDHPIAAMLVLGASRIRIDRPRR